MDIGFTAGPKPVGNYFKFTAENGFKRLDLGCNTPVNFPHTFNEERVKAVKELGKRGGDQVWTSYCLLREYRRDHARS